MRNRIKENIMKAGNGTIYMLPLLPAVTLGIFAMAFNGVVVAIWAQQAAALLFFFVMGVILYGKIAHVHSTIWTCIMTLLLGCTLFYPPVGGAKRWLDIGFLNINAAMLLVPALIVLLENERNPYPFVLCITVILGLQPDLSQLVAFAAAMVPLLFKRKKEVFWKCLTVLCLIAALIGCAFTPCTIETVCWSEGILQLFSNGSLILMALGWLSLAIIPSWLLVTYLKKKESGWIKMAVYYAVLLLFILTGDYPVPFMGFGLSPIAGYAVAGMVLPTAESRRR